MLELAVRDMVITILKDAMLEVTQLLDNSVSIVDTRWYKKRLLRREDFGPYHVEGLLHITPILRVGGGGGGVQKDKIYPPEPLMERSLMPETLAQF